jgi:xanthine dehydrogenase accessory factor
MKDILTKIKLELDQGKDVVLATIVDQKGSAPRAPGTRFMIRPDGSFEGTIGGGKVEAQVLDEAQKVFREKKNRILHFRLTGDDAAETEMICGGELEILLDFFPGAESSPVEFFDEIYRLQQLGKTGLIVTLIEDRPSAGPLDSKFLYVPGEEPSGNEQPWAKEVRKILPEFMEAGQYRLMEVMLQGKETRMFLEPLVSGPHLYLFGAGHVSAALCPLVKKVGFKVTVFDDRIEFANTNRFPDADEIVVRSLDRILEDESITSNAFAVIMTRGHLHDHQVLRQALGYPFHYIGMIGSRHKRETIFRALRQENFSEDLINSVHTPIGLDINAETPEEIAVSIVAELIQVRNKA